MLNSCIIKQEDYVMFLYVTIFVLTALVCVSDSLFQSLLLELIGELLTTILIPYNILQGEDSLAHNMVFFNRQHVSPTVLLLPIWMQNRHLLGSEAPMDALVKVLLQCLALGIRYKSQMTVSLIVVVSALWYDAQIPVIRLGRILPLSEAYLLSLTFNHFYILLINKNFDMMIVLEQPAKTSGKCLL